MAARMRRSTRPAAIAATGLLITLLSAVAVTADPPASAWNELIRNHPGAVARLSPDQRAILEMLSPEEARRWSTGIPLDEILTLDGRTLADWLADRKLTGPAFEMPWWSVDGGGWISTGGGFTIAGTIGQHDAGISTGGSYTIAGGFWGPAYSGFPFFADGFEGGTTDAWSATSP